MTKLKLFWLDLVESEPHDNQLTLLDLSPASKVMLKSHGLHWRYSVYGEVCWPHQSFSISRDQKNELYPIPKYTLCWRRKPLPSRCILLFSVGWSTAAQFIDINCDQKYRLQKVQNHAAKALFCKSRHEDIRSRHFSGCQWKKGIIFKIATFVFCVFDGTQPQDLSPGLYIYDPRPVRSSLNKNSFSFSF